MRIHGSGSWLPVEGRPSQSDLDQLRRNQAAESLSGILELHLHTSLYAQEAHETGPEAWIRRFRKPLAGSFEEGSMRQARRVWNRWTRWLQSHTYLRVKEPSAPSPLALATWLDDVAAGGPTAARGVLSGMRWLRANLGLSGLPLDSPLLRGFVSPHPAKPLRQAAELPLKVWSQYSLLAREAAGPLQLLSALAMYIATVTLRFKHAQRHTFVHDRCGSRTLVGYVSRGKVKGGAAFYVAGPAFEAPDRPTFGRMYDLLWTLMPQADFLVPDIKGALQD